MVLRCARAKRARELRYEVIRHRFTHVRNDRVKAMSRGLSERKQLTVPACPAVETSYSVHIEIQLF